ncbi:hypothetical protein IAD21_01263 [Abditibacteriota bacterium]|nr:hypothetical protein IAD21_01263 [Abditibacteriota bacterium]
MLQNDDPPQKILLPLLPPLRDEEKQQNKPALGVADIVVWGIMLFFVGGTIYVLVSQPPIRTHFKETANATR